MKRVLIITAAALALVAIGTGGSAHAGGGCHGRDEVQFTDSAADTVVASECAFVPTVVRVSVGREITWLNKDPVAHTFTGVARSWGDLKEYQQGESVAYKFDKPGVFPYFCELHPGMVGAVVVGDAPAASTGDTGVSAVSAVSGGGTEADEAANKISEDAGGGRSGTEVAVAIAALVATLGAVAATPSALRRIRTRG